MGNQQAKEANSVGGKTLVYLPGMLKSRVVWSIGEAERLRGSAPYTPEVVAVFQMNYTNWIGRGYIGCFIQNLYREDLFYADKEFTVWSLTGPDGSEGRKDLEKFSERFRRLYPGYELEYYGHIRASPETPTINLELLQNLFLSKDEGLWQRNKWLFEAEGVFLDGQPIRSNKIAFTSFPRSGNTFLRKYLQLLTGIPTGSDNTLHTDTILQMQGLKGEDIVDDTCWIVKSHSPWIMEYAPPFSSNKVLCIVRNPTESNISWLNCVHMQCHSVKVPFDVDQVYPNFWEWWTKDCMGHMNNWYQTFMRDARKRDAPILFVRFEDLVMNPEPELLKMMQFILGVTDLKDTNAERRVKEVIAMGAQATVTYALKDTTRKYNGNKHRYTEEQNAWIKENFKEMLHFFGYAKLPQDPENVTGFYDYDGKDEEMNRIYKGYIQQNNEVQDWVNSMNEEEKAQCTYHFTPKEKEVPLLDFSTAEKAMGAVGHFYEKKYFGRSFEPCD